MIKKGSKGVGSPSSFFLSRINFDLLYDMMDAMCHTSSYLFTMKKLGRYMGMDGRVIGQYMPYLFNCGAVSIFDVKGRGCIYIRYFERDDIQGFMDVMMDNYCYSFDR